MEKGKLKAYIVTSQWNENGDVYCDRCKAKLEECGKW